MIRNLLFTAYCRSVRQKLPACIKGAPCYFSNMAMPPWIILRFVCKKKGRNFLLTCIACKDGFFEFWLLLMYICCLLEWARGMFTAKAPKCRLKQGPVMKVALEMRPIAIKSELFVSKQLPISNALIWRWRIQRNKHAISRNRNYGSKQDMENDACYA